MTEPVPAENTAPTGANPIQTLRERLGSMGNLTQRQVDEMAARLRANRPGRHRAS